MAKPRKHELVQCSHFQWRLLQRNGIWYADGRSNQPNPGRHSLGVRERSEALTECANLDRVRAEDLGLVPRSARTAEAKALPLAEGRRLYEAHIQRPRVAGGVGRSTVKRYRTVFDKFLLFAQQKGVTDWHGVTSQILTAYAAELESRSYAHKTLLNELTTLKQAFKWMVEEGLLNREPINMPLKKAESERAYCWTPAEVDAILEQCTSVPELGWLHGVLVALACTGLRIGELAGLRWGDIDLERGILQLTDESGRNGQTGERRQLKSRRSRHLPIRQELAAALRKLPRRGKYVFHGPRGGRLKPDTVRRIFVREVVEPLTQQFPKRDEGEKSFEDGRLHSFRHYFCSLCANSGVPERIVMEWLGHADSEMVRRYYHLNDEESRRHMDGLNPLGDAGGRSAGGDE